MENKATHVSLMLYETSKRCEGFSGRALRKLPFLAHALFIKGPTSTVEEFIGSLNLAIDHELKERSLLSSA